MDKLVIGRKLRELRMEKNETLAKASQRMGVTISALAMYERGERLPRDEIKVKIAHYFQKTVGEIFFAE